MASGRQRYSIISDGLPTQLPDIDPDETREWVDSFDSVTRTRGRGRARYLMLRLLERAREQQVGVPGLRSTDYINTIPPEREPWFPGDEYVERRIRAYIRWNAAIMVSRANRPGLGVGGHIATYASAASLYEVGFNHFFRGKDHGESGDQVFFQGHAAPGIYARAFLEGRLAETQLDGFRQELSHQGGGLPSYPHPRLMPDFWEFPTVSMGLGPLNAIYQARFNRYLLARELHDTSRSHVWAFCGDGEMDEPEALGAIGLAAREELDNLTFVINCNLQRLDGPVRGNGKIIQELEAFFRGAGWNVIKVIWGRDWDPLLAQDTDGVLVNKMNTTPDGQFQTYSVESGAYIREHFFGSDPRLRKMVEHLSDDELRNLSRGGHDYRKVYAAFKAAREHVGQPTVILTHTIKGWTLGKDFEARNATHQMKKLTLAELKEFRDRLYLPIPDSDLEGPDGLPPYYHPGQDSDEIQYMKERRAALGGVLPRRVSTRQAAAAAAGLGVPGHDEGVWQAVRRHHDGVRPDPEGPHEGPGHRRQVRAGHPRRGAHVRHGLAVPDREDLLAVRADLRGGGPQPAAVVQGVRARPDPARGHLRGGRDGVGDRGRHLVRHPRHAHDPGVRVLLDVRVAAHRRRDVGARRPAGPRLPAGSHGGPHDADRRGPAAQRRALGAARLGVRGVRLLRPGVGVRGLGDREGRAAPDVRRDRQSTRTARTSSTTSPSTTSRTRSPRRRSWKGSRRASCGACTGTRPLRPTAGARILASGVAMPWALRARQLLAEDWGVAADVWSVTSWTELRRDALAAESHNLLHPDEEPRTPYVTSALAGAGSDTPVVAVSDWIRSVPDQISRWVPGSYTSLGTDGFGFSDTRPAARRFFHVDAESITLAVLAELARSGAVDPSLPAQAIAKYKLDLPVSEALS